MTTTSNCRLFSWCLASVLAITACEDSQGRSQSVTGTGGAGTAGAGTGGQASADCGKGWSGDGGAPACPTGGVTGELATGGRGGGSAGGAGVGGATGSATCSCTQPTTAPTAVVLPWDCFCDIQPQACMGLLTDALTTAHANSSLCYARAEYPACGLVALYSVYQIHGAWAVTTFDAATGKVVGVDQESDTPTFSCPGNAPTYFSRRAGHLPDCKPTTCEVFGDCAITAPPPCAK